MNSQQVTIILFIKYRLGTSNRRYVATFMLDMLNGSGTISSCTGGGDTDVGSGSIIY